MLGIFLIQVNLKFLKNSTHGSVLTTYIETMGGFKSIYLETSFVIYNRRCMYDRSLFLT